MPPASMYGNAGRHDFIICQKGAYWTIETKVGYNKPSSLQKSFADEVRKAGGRCYLINEFNYGRVQAIAEGFDMTGPVVPDDNFETYKGGKEYAGKAWGTCSRGR